MRWALAALPLASACAPAPAAAPSPPPFPSLSATPAPKVKLTAPYLDSLKQGFPFGRKGASLRSALRLPYRPCLPLRFGSSRRRTHFARPRSAALLMNDGSRIFVTSKSLSFAFVLESSRSDSPNCSTAGYGSDW